MILQSTINNNSYAWVRIPKTATRSYTKLLDTTNNDRHTEYSKIVETLDHKIPGVTVVRNPHTRLISALKHFCGVLHAQLQNPKNNNHIIRTIPTENTIKFCNFFYTNYDKNCVPRNPIMHNLTMETRINPALTFWPVRIALFIPFFITQKSMIDGAINPIIFRYENLTEFNTWIETELGIDTSKLEYIGKADTNLPFNIDLQSVEIQNLAEYLFEEDYITFGY
jgi:hypothetical protein